MDVGALLVRIGADIAIVVGWSLVIGFTAPRWPRRWLERDAGPLRLTGADTVARYRRLGVSRLTTALPEGGAWFGGAAKDRLPGTDTAALEAYLVEVRRAEWVHLLSLLAVIPVLVVGPWWLGVAFAAVVVVVNVPFLLVLRYNRVRLTGILRRSRDRADRPGGADPGSRADPTRDQG